MRSHFYLIDMTAFRLSPRFFSVSNYVLNTTTLYGCIFEQRDRISVREKKVGDERSTS